MLLALILVHLLLSCSLQVPVNLVALVRCCGVSKILYQNARATVQKVLCVGRNSTTPRDLCIRFGCARLELPIRTAFASFKERLIAALPPADRDNVDFTRPVFLAAVFFLVARKHRVKVERDRLFSSFGITSMEFNAALISATATLPELVPPKGKEKLAEDPDRDAGLGHATATAEKTKKARGEGRKRVHFNAAHVEGAKNDAAGKIGKRTRKQRALTETELREAVVQFAAA